MKHRTIDLLNGNILSVLTGLAVPIMATALVQAVYNLTDMAWIGMVGSDAVAAVGAAGMYTWFSTGVAALAKMGGQVQVAQAIGGGKQEKAAAYGRGALQMALMLALAYGMFTNLFAESLIGFFHLNSADTIRGAVIYLRIACGLILFAFTGQTLTGLYTASGNSRTPFLANCIGMCLNLLLDPVLILGIGPFPALGVTGAAIATVSAQMVVCLVLILSAGKDPLLSTCLHIWKRTRLSYFQNIGKIGIPAALQEMVYCGISMVLTRFITNWGDGAVAVQRVGGQIESLAWMTSQGFGTAINAFTGQNYGAGNLQRVKKGYHTAAAAMFTWGLLTTALLYFGAEPIFRLFIREADVVPIGVSYLKIIAVGETFMCMELMTVGAMSGLGLTLEASVITILFTTMRIPLSMALGSTALGLDGVWWALSLSSIMKGILFFCFYKYRLSNFNMLK